MSHCDGSLTAMSDVSLLTLLRERAFLSPDDPAYTYTDYEQDWDGVAEQWFESEEGFNEVYGRPSASDTREDTLNHVSRFERIIVREIEVIP